MIPRMIRWLTHDDRLLLALTLVTKLVVLAIGVIAIWVADGRVPDLLEPWDRWDAPHYTDIAVFGYMANDPGNLVPPPGYAQVFPGDLDLYIVFFPLFPWLVMAVNAVKSAEIEPVPPGSRSNTQKSSNAVLGPTSMPTSEWLNVPKSKVVGL